MQLQKCAICNGSSCILIDRREHHPFSIVSHNIHIITFFAHHSSIEMPNNCLEFWLDFCVSFGPPATRTKDVSCDIKKKDGIRRIINNQLNPGLLEAITMNHIFILSLIIMAIPCVAAVGPSGSDNVASELGLHEEVGSSVDYDCVWGYNLCGDCFKNGGDSCSDNGIGGAGYCCKKGSNAVDDWQESASLRGYKKA